MTIIYYNFQINGNIKYTTVIIELFASNNISYIFKERSCFL